MNAAIASTDTEAVWKRYEQFASRPPQIVFEWHDDQSEAQGWLIINSLKGGAAGGGTRMRAGLRPDDVTFLAKAMELKFAFTGPPIGGAKSGIDFDPHDPRKGEVLRRWFEAIRPELTNRYGTAGDLNVNELREVVPLCAAVGVSHPQMGVLRGHFGLEGEALGRRAELMDLALNQPVGGKYGIGNTCLWETVTGY
ncbi:MAG: Glu/Leu/Phe/Val dehydrogenase dimerization domain-containing protein, partial [Gemmatimonadota bacterium]